MIFFRVDSNSIIAGGHVMRCISIASVLKKAGENVMFLVADDNPVPVLCSYGMKYMVLCSDWQNLMLEKDAVIEILKHEKNPVLIIDTYSVTKQYTDALNDYCKIVYLGSKQEYLGDVQMIINYSTNIDHSFYDNYYTPRTKLLLGPSFAPLREEFQNATHNYKNKIRRILITTGNTDNDNIVGKIIESILKITEGKNISIAIIIGRMFRHKESLHSLYDNNPNVELHENVKSMSSLMKESDIAISANGTTIYELSAMGIPIISFAMVEEQVESGQALAKLNIIEFCGATSVDLNGCLKKIIEKFYYYLHHNDELIHLAKRAHKLIDGTGSFKIVEAILENVK